MREQRQYSNPRQALKPHSTLPVVQNVLFFFFSDLEIFSVWDLSRSISGLYYLNLHLKLELPYIWEQIKASHCVSTCSHGLKHWKGSSVWHSFLFLSQSLQNLLFMQATQAVTQQLNPVVLVILEIIRSICKIKQKSKQNKTKTENWQHQKKISAMKIKSSLNLLFASWSHQSCTPKSPK